MKKRILAAALAVVLSGAVKTDVAAQTLSLSSGDLFSWVGKPYYLKFIDGTDGTYSFYTVGASGNWEPGLPFLLVNMNWDEFENLFYSNQISSFTNTPTDPPVVIQQIETLEEDPTGGVTATPEPISMLLLGTGLAGIGGVAHRRRRKENTD